MGRFIDMTLKFLATIKITFVFETICQKGVESKASVIEYEMPSFMACSQYTQGNIAPLG